MKRCLYIFLFLSFSAAAQQHCGYDFTSYVVLQVREEGKKEFLKGMTVSLLDADSNPAVNTGNRYSWTSKDQVLTFSRITVSVTDRSPHAAESYVLQVTNEFPADEMRVRVEDPSGVYATTEFPLYAYNMYVLCTTQAQQAMSFGRRTNKPVEVYLKKG